MKDLTVEDIRQWHRDFMEEEKIKNPDKREYTVYAYCPTLESAKAFWDSFNKCLIEVGEKYINANSSHDKS